MRHIVEQLGEKVNLLECTEGEYQTLKSFFATMGIKLSVEHHAIDKVSFKSRVQLQACFDCNLQVVEDVFIDENCANSLGAIKLDDDAYLDIFNANGKLYGCFNKI